MDELVLINMWFPLSDAIDRSSWNLIVRDDFVGRLCLLLVRPYQDHKIVSSDTLSMMHIFSRFAFSFTASLRYEECVLANTVG